VGSYEKDEIDIMGRSSDGKKKSVTKKIDKA
jgi:hypothetical protein